MEFFSVIKDVLLEDGTIQINGFGAFSIKERSARNCYNFRTKEVCLFQHLKQFLLNKVEH